MNLLQLWILLFSWKCVQSQTEWHNRYRGYSPIQYSQTPSYVYQRLAGQLSYPLNQTPQNRASEESPRYAQQSRTNTNSYYHQNRVFGIPTLDGFHRPDGAHLQYQNNYQPQNRLAYYFDRAGGRVNFSPNLIRPGHAKVLQETTQKPQQLNKIKEKTPVKTSNGSLFNESQSVQGRILNDILDGWNKINSSRSYKPFRGDQSQYQTSDHTNNKTLDDEHDLFGKIGVWSMEKLPVQQNATNTTSDNHTSKGNETLKQSAFKVFEHDNFRKKNFGGGNDDENKKLEILSGTSDEQNSFLQISNKNTSKWNNSTGDSLITNAEYSNNKSYGLGVESNLHESRVMTLDRLENTTDFGVPGLNNQSEAILIKNSTSQGDEKDFRPDFGTSDTGLSFRLEDLKFSSTNSSDFDNTSLAFSSKLEDNLVKESNSMLIGKVETITPMGTCGKAFRMTGGGYIEVYTKNLKNLPKTAMAFATWVRLRRTDRMNVIYSSNSEKGIHHNMEIRSKKLPDGSPNGSIRWVIRTSGSNTVFVLQTDSIVPSGIWTHLAAVYNGEQGIAAIYINGLKRVKEEEYKSVIPWGTSILLGSVKSTLTGNMAGHLEGDLARTKLFNRQLSTSEISSLAKECKFGIGETSYFFSVCTGDEFTAGSPSKVFVALSGSKGQFGEIKLGADFSSGCSQLIELHGPDVGEIELLSIRKDTSGLIGKSWHLKKVEITVGDRETGTTFIFPCDCWFKGDKLQHHLKSGNEAKGGWAPWSDWSGCGSGMCGGDRKVRTRACTNPVPLNGLGQQCRKADGSFDNFEAEVQPCPVDGGWGAWSSWTECSKTCDGALVTRVRKCDNPAPANNGKICEGKKSETKKDCTRPCNMAPVDGQWSLWSDWSACSQTCGGSVVTRTRSCNNPKPAFGGRECPGNNTEAAEDCLNPCPVDGGFGEWSMWGECSKTCGQGVKVRSHDCNRPLPAFSGNNCTGPWTEEKPCKIKECPNSINGAWGAWGGWSPCTEKIYCNKGVMRRTRKCDNPAPKNGGDLCPGLNSEEKVCPTANCKVEGLNEADKKKVDPKSFISWTCNAREAFYTQGTHADEIPQSIYNKYYAVVAKSLKTGYFARTVKKQDNQDIALFCFEPSEMPTVGQMEKEFPAFKLVPSLPDYDKPKEDVKVPGIAVGLKPDLTLYSGEFVLGESQAYTAFKSGQSSLSLSGARFLYQEKPGFRGIVAYGKEQFANATFDLEITLGPSATGSAASSTNAAEIVKSMALPTASTFIPSSLSGAGDTFLKFILDYLVELGLTRVPVTMVTETAGESGGTLTRRITGTISSSEGLGLFTMEIIKQVEFAVGFTTGKTQFATLTQKLFKKKLNLFGQMRDASVGIAFATKNFKVTSATGFSSEPLKSAIATDLPAGLVLATQGKMPEDCSRDTFCKLAQLIIGKDTILYFNGNINLKGFKIVAGIKDRKITDKVKFSTIELFVSMQIPDITVSFGFKVAIEFPVKGEIYKNNILQPNSSITVSGKLEFNGVAVTGVLSMEGMWRKIFGVSYIAIGQLTLGLTITLSGIPTALQFEGRLELGNDCYFPEDFKNEGQCISQHAKLGVNPSRPQDFFIYADLSPVTLGKILRMLGSKLTLPAPVESAGFPEGLTVSGALSDQQITFNDQVKTVKKGIFIKGKVNLFGLAFALTLQLSDKNILCETELDPINLANSVVITRSLTDKTKGPIFKLSAARDPLAIEVHVEGAVKIFGVETAILFKLTKEQVEAALSLNLFNKLNAKLSITAGYGESLEKTGFTAKFVINTGFGEVEEGTSKDVQTSMQKARENLQQAQQILKDSNDACRKKAATYCSLCQSITCEQITENCKHAMDKFNHYIGGSVNRFGGWFVDVAKEIASHFRVRDRRYIEFFPGRAQLMTKLRRKRFVGKVLCEDIAPAMCKGARILCEGSCSITKHVTKGVCWGLDKAQVLLHRVENTTYWVKKAAQVLQENMLVIHSLGFEVAVSPSVLSKVAATVDLTFFKTRQQFSLELSVQSLKENAKKIADLAIAGFSEIYHTRLSDPVYDPPSAAADYALSGTFRIENKETKACLSIPDLRPGADIKTAVCLEDSSRWTYTLTGQIMNIQSGLCLSAKDKEGAKLQQLDCKIGGSDQNFTCEENKLRLAGTELCITEEGVKKVAILKSCEDKDSQKIQEWGIRGDPRKIVCDEFVPDIALGKPTTQSSNFQFADIGKTDYINPEDKNAVFYKVGPELAVDGDMSAFLKDGSCSHTRQNQDPWWRVDLLQEHIVTDVSVVSPYGGVKVEPLANFEIRVGVSQTFSRNPMCGERVGQLHYGEVWTSKCDPPLSGQYVSVQRFGNVFMTICEVAVFSRLDNQGKCTRELRRKRREISEGLEDLDTLQ